MKRKALVTKSTTVATIQQQLIEEFGKFPLHHLNAKWQYQQFLMKKKTLHKQELLAILDFSENYRCVSQDEAQSAHWNYLQTTIHPIVFYYNCNQCTDCKKIVTEAVICVSDDLTHDSSSVEVFTQHAIEHMKTRGDFTKLTQFTDGCSAQYKSRKPFLGIQQSVENIGMPIERNFFGSRHGKNPSDGESAVVKSGATRAVKCRRSIIQTPKDFYEFGRVNMTLNELHYKRKFLFVSTMTIQKVREEEQLVNQSLKPLPGTRSLHVVKAHKGGLLTRNLSCFCTGCENEDGHGSCKNNDYVQEWQSTDMKRPQARSLPKRKKVSMYKLCK